MKNASLIICLLLTTFGFVMARESGAQGMKVRSAQAAGIANNQEPIIQYGYLVVSSPTEAVASIDGQGAYLIILAENLRGGKLPVGTHNVSVVAGKQQWSTRVQIRVGKTSNVTANIKSAAVINATNLSQKKQKDEQELKQQRLYELELEQKEQERLIPKQAAEDRAWQ